MRSQGWLVALLGGVAACSQGAARLAPPEPGVVYTYPLDGQLDVPLGARVMVTFSEPVVPGALAACAGTATAVTGAFCLVGPDGPIAAIPEVVGDGRTVQLPGAALAPGTTYMVYARAALAPTATNLPTAGPLVRFTTRSVAPRAAPPTLVAINGAPPAAPEAFRPLFESSTIRLVFSEPLDPRTALAPGAIELVDQASGAAVAATVLQDGIHVAIDPVADLAAGRPYVVKLSSQVTDLGGQPLAPAAIDVTPRRTGSDRPVLEVLRPRMDGDRGPARAHAGAERNLITIDEPLIGRETSRLLASALTVELGDPGVLGGPIAFTIRRGQRLRATGLDVKLGGELAVGLATGDIQIELLSDAGGRIYRSPFHPASQVPDNDRSPLLVDLSMDLAVYATDPTGSAVLTQSVLGVQASGVVVAADGVLDIQAVIAMDLDLLGVARAPTHLALELITDPAAQPEPDRVAPRVIASLPGADGELAVDVAPQLIFSEPIELGRARAGGLRLETQAGEIVPSVVDSHGAAIVIRPRAPLAYDTSYRVVLADITDVAGNPLVATAPLDLVTPALGVTAVPLTVSSVHPGVACALTGATATSPGRCDGAPAGDDAYRPFTLAANQPIRATFTQPLAPASVALGAACNAGSVRIEEVDASGACAAAVPGTLTARDRALAFYPDAPWRTGTRYRLTLVSGGNVSCAAGQVCGLNATTASFDPLRGGVGTTAGGPSLVIDFTGAAASAATLVATETTPFTDGNGSGFLDPGERLRDDNRVAVRIAGVTGVVSSASITSPDCLPATAERDGCMYLGGALPVELLPVARDCPLPGGQVAATCVPVVLSPQAMYATSLAMRATVVQGTTSIQIDTATGMSVLRIREPATGPVTGYLIDDRGTPTLVIALALYLDAPDMVIPLVNHDLHSKPLGVTLRGPLRFLPDGRIAITVVNVADVALDVNIDATNLAGGIKLVIPRGEMRLQLASAPVRGGLP
jgi:Bacterial Ig-like domain